jgi:branched-chain amino acid transport system permease protein
VRLASAARFGWLVPPALTALLCVVALTAMGEYEQRQVIVIVVYTLIVCGLNLSFGYGGELALGQVAMFAAGAYVTGVLAQHGHYELLLALIASVAAAGAVGVVSGVPGLRLGHWSLALTSFFLVLLIPDVLVLLEEQTGGLQGLTGILDPTLAGVRLEWEGFFVFAVVLGFLWLMAIRNIVLSRHGHALRVLRESPQLASALGLSVYRLRLRAYVLGSLPAGAAGCVFAYLTGFISPDAFTLNLAIALLAASVIGGVDSIYGAPVGAALLVLGPLQTSGAERWSTLLYGIFLVAVGVLLSGGLASIGRKLMRRAGWPADGAEPAPAAAAGTSFEVPGERLAVRDVRKAFDGVQALDGVDLEAQPGQVLAILGPNGAGKTTLLNAISGFVRPDAGEIVLGERSDLRGLAPDRIARRGISRTFQTPLIPRGMTAREVVECGRLGRPGPRLLGALLRTPRLRRTRAEDRHAADAALSVAGLGDVASTDAQALPLGTRRLLEVVRAVVAQPGLILLDEPAAGLDDAGQAELGRLIRRARDAGGTVIVVEHNVRFVLDLADRVVVMALGRVIAEGSPDEIRRNDEVIATYLGSRSRSPVTEGRA